MFNGFAGENRTFRSVPAFSPLLKLSFIPSHWAVALGGTFYGIPNLKGRERSFLEVKVFDNDVDKALKVLKNKLSKNGLFKELKLRRAYEKPSVKRKRKALEARRRLAKIQRRRHS